jgi:hypothetical protein
MRGFAWWLCRFECSYANIGAVTVSDSHICTRHTNTDASPSIADSIANRHTRTPTDTNAIASS